mmetsp:Transcript_24838/g.68792  ORF Transcript_24838/g.68792 Transcript_24838/m.68792 type:complete len:91 (+) Transcript_24838:1433-1705(+)
MRMHRAPGVLPLWNNSDGTDSVIHVSELLSKVKGRTRCLAQSKDGSLISPRKLLKKAMMAWMPAADALVAMIAKHVPSPIEAQKLRAGVV